MTSNVMAGKVMGSKAMTGKAMTGPQASLLDQGERLHLHHGPIDLLISLEAPRPVRMQGFRAAAARFETLLDELVLELPQLRQGLERVPLPEARLRGRVARRMQRACLPHVTDGFITPMAAVAGAVADEILTTILDACAPVKLPEKLVVNNGGDIAFHAQAGEKIRARISAPDGQGLGQIDLQAETARHWGLATSGWQGRSFSRGIADSVTVLAHDAASADAAATMIANAVDLPDHPLITRAPACSLSPDSDLGDRLVTTAVGRLSPAETASALARGQAHAAHLLAAGQIMGAALFLQGDLRLVGSCDGLWQRPAPAIMVTP